MEGYTQDPDDIVGDDIIKDLRALGVLSDSTLEKIKPKLVAGTLTAADWIMAIELERPAKEKAG